MGACRTHGCHTLCTRGWPSWGKAQPLTKLLGLLVLAEALQQHPTLPVMCCAGPAPAALSFLVCLHKGISPLLPCSLALLVPHLLGLLQYRCGGRETALIRACCDGGCAAGDRPTLRE